MKSKGTAAVLALFLGVFGAHWFYLGRNPKGYAYLIVWFLGLFMYMIPSMVVGIMAFIDFLIFALDDSQSFHDKYDNL
jgi:TM2 domain-containing membrane protein YozV